jgi:uncharacterized damage-inducible protein DinB
MNQDESGLSWVDQYRFAHEERDRFFRVLESQPAAALEWRPVEHKNVKTVLYHLRHMLNSEHWWIDTVVGGRPIVHHATKDYPDLASVLRRMRELRERTLRFAEDLEPGALDRVYQGHDGPRPLRWILWHLIDHESHHRAQCYLMLRLRDPEAPPLQGATER